MDDERSSFFDRQSAGGPSRGGWEWPPPEAEDGPAVDGAPMPSEPAGDHDATAEAPTPGPEPEALDVRAPAQHPDEAPTPADSTPHPGGHFEHVGASTHTVRDERRLPVPALAGAALVVLALVLGGWWWSRSDDSPADVAVAGETTVRSAPSTTGRGGVTTTAAPAPAPGPADPIVEAAYAAEVQRACAAVTADPGVTTESIIEWDPAWAAGGRSERTLRDDVNNCALPARDAAMAALAAQEDEERLARVAACGQLDGAALAATPDALVGRCGVLGLRVVERDGRSCEIVGRWDAAGTPPGPEGGAPAVLRTKAAGRCPLLDGVGEGWTGTVWATVAGSAERDGTTVPLLTVEQVRAAG